MSGYDGLKKGVFLYILLALVRPIFGEEQGLIEIAPDAYSCIGALLTFSSQKVKIPPAVATANTKALIDILESDPKLSPIERDEMIEFLTSLDGDPNAYIEVRVGKKNIWDRVDQWAHVSDSVLEEIFKYPAEFVSSGFVPAYQGLSENNKLLKPGPLSFFKFLRNMGRFYMATGALGLVWTYFFVDPGAMPPQALEALHALKTLFWLGLSMPLITTEGIISRAIRINKKNAASVLVSELPRIPPHGAIRNFFVTQGFKVPEGSHYFFNKITFSDGFVDFLKQKLAADEEWFVGQKGRKQLFYISTDQSGEPILFYAAGGL